MAWIWHCCGCGVGRLATALNTPLGWESPYATDAALKGQKDKKKKKSMGMEGLMVGLEDDTKHRRKQT